MVLENAEYGVMVMRDGKAWGSVQNPDVSWTESIECWLDPTDCRVELYDYDKLKKPTDVSYDGCSDWQELLEAKLVEVTRKTVVVIED